MQGLRSTIDLTVGKGWLDRGELDKLIERRIQESSGHPTPMRESPTPTRRPPHATSMMTTLHMLPHAKRMTTTIYAVRTTSAKKRDWLEDLFDIFD